MVFMVFNSYKELHDLSPSLIDARFELASICFDKSTFRLCIDCWIYTKIGNDNSEAQSDCPNRRVWQKVRLHLETVKSADVNVFDQVSYYEIGLINYDNKKNILMIRGHYGVIIVIEIEQIVGSIEFFDVFKEKW